MKPSEIISLARRQTGCTEDIVTTDEAFRFLNFVIEDFGADIRASDSGHGFDILNINVTAGLNTYQIDANVGELSNKFPISKLEKVWYRMPDGKWRDIDVRFIDKIDINDIPNEGEPRICYLTGTTLNLIPEPKTSTVLQLWGYDYNNELTSASGDDVEAKIWIPKRWHYILVEGLKYRMYGNMGVNFEGARTNARAFYDNEKMKALQNIMDRGQESDEPYYPDLNFLNY